MLKTYLYVPKELNNKIIKFASAQKESKAKVMRIALEEGLEVLKRKKDESIDLMYRVADIGRKVNSRGPKDLSTRLDEYLWDEKNE